MTPKPSAGLLLYRTTHGDLEVMLLHMGGPFWQRKDAGAWSIPKGEYDPSEQPLAAARREFAEETGLVAPPGEPIDLGDVRQSSGKLVHAWAQHADVDVTKITSNSFAMEWPKGSGRMREFPEVDRAGWFDLETAREKLVKGQVPFLQALAALVQERS
ncbi:MAG TPA: NUDIX domain-containing protein [Solirubrobacteraceae bacterium]|nr:NUDIX domain-containing protein [Solirubrobacteraceae bacterium]